MRIGPPSRPNLRWGSGRGATPRAVRNPRTGRRRFSGRDPPSAHRSRGQGWPLTGVNAQPTLRTERLLLRPFRLDDAPVVQRLAGAREIADTTLTIPHPYLDGTAESWIGTHAGAWERQERVTFAITSEDDGVVGAVALDLRLAHRRAELGYWIGRPFWNRGFATEAVRAVIAFGFETLGLIRIHASHLTRNPASGRVMVKVGMQLEGTLRRHVIKWDHPEDLAVYAILRAD